MSFEDDFLHRYPRIAAHLMCERDVYQLGPAEAALIIRDAKYRFRCEHEWVEWKYGGDAVKVIRKAVRNRHKHDRETYRVALALVDLSLHGAL